MFQHSNLSGIISCSGHVLVTNSLTHHTTILQHMCCIPRKDQGLHLIRYLVFIVTNSVGLTFKGRSSWYILIIKANKMHGFSYSFDKVLYMFRIVPLSIIRSISTLYTRNVYLSCYFRRLSASRLAWQIPIAWIQCWDTPDDGQWNCPKHVECFMK